MMSPSFCHACRNSNDCVREGECGEGLIDLKTGIEIPARPKLAPKPDLTPKPAGPTPMILSISKTTLLWLLAQQKVLVPATADVTVPVPGGGDWSNTDLDIGDGKDDCIEIRWKQ